jgi:DNA polymerase-3 subunit delta'
MQFSQVIGQSKVINSLIKIVGDGRISHCQLFLGQSGSGVFALALAYAQFINCTDKQYFNSASEEEIIADSCGKCPSCLKYSKLAHPDLHLIFPNATTKTVVKSNDSSLFLSEFREFVIENDGYIDLDDWYEKLDVGNSQGLINVRDASSIISSLSIKAYEADYKITIIWGFDKLHYEAAPKLLKILEEPYEKTLFFLIADNSEAILPTILSRTQLVKIPYLSEQAIANYLEEKEGLSPDKAKQKAIIAQGSLIRAKQLCSDEENEFEALFMQWSRTMINYKTKIIEVNKVVEDFYTLGRERQKMFFLFAMNIFRKSLYVNLGIESSVKFFEISDQRFRANFPNFVSKNNIDKIYKLLEEALFHIIRNGNTKMVFFDLSIKIGRLLQKQNI